MVLSEIRKSKDANDIIFKYLHLIFLSWTHSDNIKQAEHWNLKELDSA